MGDVGTLCGSKNSDTLELTYSADRPLTAVIEDFEPSSDKRSATVSTSRSKSVRDNDYFDGDVEPGSLGSFGAHQCEREALGLSPLTISDGLIKGATIRVEEIRRLAQTGALSDHYRPESVGSSEWYSVLEGKYNVPGENLVAGARTPEAVLQDWIG